MQINISTRHGHLSVATQAKITSRVEKLLRYNDRLAAVDVIVDLEHKETPGVEFRVSVEKAEDLVATVQEENLMAAVESGLRKVEQQLRKHKEKMIDHRGTGRRTPVPDAGEPEMPEEG
jgi:putative sigma-54 modulation protein